MSRHACNNTNDDEWMHCSACGGRVHDPECTSKRNRLVDCCKARHDMLAAQGRATGSDGTPMAEAYGE